MLERHLDGFAELGPRLVLVRIFANESGKLRRRCDPRLVLFVPPHDDAVLVHVLTHLLYSPRRAFEQVSDIGRHRASLKWYRIRYRNRSAIRYRLSGSTRLTLPEPSPVGGSEAIHGCLSGCRTTRRAGRRGRHRQVTERESTQGDGTHRRPGHHHPRVAGTLRPLPD